MENAKLIIHLQASLPVATFCSGAGMQYLELLELCKEGFHPAKVCSQKLPAGTAAGTRRLLNASATV